MSARVRVRAHEKKCPCVAGPAAECRCNTADSSNQTEPEGGVPKLAADPMFRQDALLSIFHLQSVTVEKAQDEVVQRCPLHRGGWTSKGMGSGFHGFPLRTDERCHIRISEDKLCWAAKEQHRYLIYRVRREWNLREIVDWDEYFEHHCYC